MGRPLFPARFPLAAQWLRILHLLRPHHLQLEDKATQPQRVPAPRVTHRRGASPDPTHGRGRPGAEQRGKWDERAERAWE